MSINLKKLYSMMTEEQKKNYYFLQVLFVVNAVLQTAGVASIAPFIALLSSQDLINKNSYLSFVYSFFGFESNTSFLVFFALVVIGLIVLSNLIAAILTWAIFKFSLAFGCEIQDSIFKYYINQDVVFHSRKNSAEVVSVITQEAPRFIYMVVQPVLLMISQLFIISLIAFGLVCVDPVISVAATIIIGGAYLAVFGLIKSRLVMHGTRIWEASNERLKILNESMGGIKEVKLLGGEQMYQDLLLKANEKSLRSGAIIGLAADLPKFVIETTALCAVMLLAIFMLVQNDSTEKIISILSLYAMAGYKLLPAAQNVYRSISQIRANAMVVDELYPNLIGGRSVELQEKSLQDFDVKKQPIILKDVCFSYPSASRPALDHVNLKINPSSIVAFVGVSGSGKSTLADLILGFLHPQTGSLLVGDAEITSKNVRAWQSHLGYVPQNIFLTDDTVSANICFGGNVDEFDEEKMFAASKGASLHDFIMTMEKKYSSPVGERGGLLSGGQRQRIGIARALYHDADILVLDEATSALDNLTEKAVIETINNLKKDKIIVMIAHRLATIQNADLVVYLDKGVVEASGSYDDLVMNCSKFRQMLAHEETLSS